jgi:hypothetical protein
MGRTEANHETPVRIAIYWIGFETGTSRIRLSSAKYCIYREFARAVKESVIGSPVKSPIYTFCAGIQKNYLQLLSFYPANIYNFCDIIRQLFTTSVIIPDNYLQLL